MGKNNDDRPGQLEYRVHDIHHSEKFDVYIDGELIAEGGNIVEIRSNPSQEEESESGMKYKCEDCGDTIMAETTDEWDCVICGGRMKNVHE